ncbi:hypothetical protein CSC94_17895 [Zhengella mangrovi]|uniref:Uncharacterized protein n=1 Tax=Zhengella mangrovi TaxID=1982044 RepID=A0A2G1QJT5_9HYPH|nr:hypothetical protein [Zhengella mangrovi]PHP65721.1 hypothetical protein CSC94_17895 [Zhengella mangrovi]
MLRSAIIATTGIVTVLAVAFLIARPVAPEAPAVSEHAVAAPKQMKSADLIVPVFTKGSVTGYIVANVAGELAPSVDDQVAAWYLSDALLQLLHDAKDVPKDEESVPESDWLRDRLEEAANRRYAAPLISKLEVLRIKYLKRI